MSGFNEEMMVEKSRYLLGMKAPNYELGELKILDTYLARINARDPETKLVKFTKKEYEELMGLTQIKPPQLKKHTQALLGKVVTIPYGKKGWEQYTLFTHARCDQDEETLEWSVELGCNEKLEPLFFNLESAGYLRYRLKNIIPLTSKYSVLLYLYFKDNLFRQTFEISLKELRETLGISHIRTYESFKYFKRDIIDKCVDEINRITDITISYERKTRGKLTVALIFTTKGKPSFVLEEPEEAEQLNLLEDFDEEDITDIDFYRTALKESSSLTNEQIEELRLTARQSSYASMLAYDRHLHGVEFDMALHKYIMAQDRYVRARSPKHYYSYLLEAIKENYADVL